MHTRDRAFLCRRIQFFKILAASFLLAALPAFAAVVDVTKAAVVGDGATMNTVSIQKAIDDCTASASGTLQFPAGRYLTGTIQIKSKVTLRLEEGATLLGSTAAGDYQNLDPFIDRSGNPMGHALIVAVDAVNVGIEGITIRCRGLKMHNNDGINIDSSEGIRVKNCDIDSGDDALVIKATSATKPCRDITATDCKLSTRTNAIKLGTESIGGFENISVTKCQITNTQMDGIALYAVGGGDLRNVTVSDVTMDGVTLPVSIRLGSRLKTFREGEQPKSGAGRLREVIVKNVSGKNIGMIGMLINGTPGHPVEALTLQNITLELPGGGAAAAAKVRLSEKEAALTCSEPPCPPSASTPATSEAFSLKTCGSIRSRPTPVPPRFSWMRKT